ncbi:tetratricopeptide repeat protein [Streptomyces sp. CA-251387]|uniref:tetratricopeptide repeat protein n=1 Tax=Streptomyces sp. CA-251387 TaxID=3240064 RepID=UPI003D8FA713
MTAEQSRRSHTVASGPRSVAAQSIEIASSGDGAHIERHVHHWPGPVPSPADVKPAGQSNVPWSDPRLFVGREDALAQLAVPPENARDLNVQTVCGLAGVGKSTLVQHHVHRSRERYTLTWWITADTHENLTAGLADLTFRLNPVFRTAATSEDAAAWAITWLSSHGGWLLVLDNVEDLSHVRPLLLESMAGHLIVTTRRDLGVEPPGTRLRLEVLGEEESVAVLTGITGHGDDPDERVAAARLAGELGHLPLALQQVGAYVVQTQSTLSDYLQRLSADPARLHAAVPEGVDPERTVTRIWHHTLQHIDRRDPTAVQLLRVLAHFAPEDIPRDTLRHALADPLDLDRSLSVLNSYSLITLTPTTVSIHRLLQSVIRSSVSQETSRRRVFSTPAQWMRSRSRLPWRRRKVRHLTADIVPDIAAAGQVLQRALSGTDSRDPKDWPRWRALLPHIEALFSQASDDHQLLFPDLLMLTCSYLLSQGLDARALAYGEMLLRAGEKFRTPDHVPPGLITALSLLTMAHCSLGNYTKACETGERGLALCAAFDEDEAELLVQSQSTMNNLAAAYRSLGRYEDALPLDQKSVEIAERLHGNHPLTSVSLSNLGRTMEKLGRYDEALELSRRALDISRDTMPAAHPTNLTNLNNLATVLLCLEHHEDAERVNLELLEQCEEALGGDHPFVSVALSNLATTYCRTSRYEEALPLARRAADISGEALGPDHPTTLTNLHNLAHIHCMLGQHGEEVALALVALKISLDAFGPEHPLSERLTALLSSHQDVVRTLLSELKPDPDAVT